MTTAQPTQSRPYVPGKQLNSDYPLIDSDPHFRRVIRYARTSDYVTGTVATACGPALLYLMERVSPSYAGKGAYGPIGRLTAAISITGGFLIFYTKSIHRFYGLTENRREIDMDMREMVDKVKRGEPPYGRSTLTEYMQGVAARNSRYTGLFLHVMPWFNFVNHPHHGVDTAKYYQQAERELEAEKNGQPVPKWESLYKG